ncbi:MAG: amidohydrolase family protein, partial [Candidatus Hodarchaeota archaeon]
MEKILIKNGHIIDGTGNAWFKADIFIKNQKISQIAPQITEPADKIIDANGLIVCPGFIDIHSHSDASLMVSNGENVLTQGVTTHVIGNCGFSLTPADIKKVKEYKLEERLSALTGVKGELKFERLDQYLDEFQEIGIAINAVPLTGHSTIRLSVLGLETRAPTDSELNKMKNLLESELKLGSFGMSTGLDYPPGSFAKTDEVTELCKVVSKYNGLYSTHFRGLFGGILGATRETIKIGEEANCKVEISHYKPFGFYRGNIRKAVKKVEQARLRGLDITFDVFPHASNSTFLYAMAPPWIYMGKGELDPDGARERLKKTKTDEEFRKQVFLEMEQLGSSFLKIKKLEDWSKVIISTPGDPTYHGKSAYEIAQEQNYDPREAIIDALINHGMKASGVYLSMTEEDNRVTLTHPLGMYGSDGMAFPMQDKVQRFPNPYCFGTYTQVLGKYVREEKLLTLQEAIRKMTSFPAQKLGLKDRGLLREGFWADITIFDKDRVIDKATYKNPTLLSEGIEY